MIRDAVVAAMLIAFSVTAAAAGSPWSPVDERAQTVLMLTGSDLGYLAPRGCHVDRGGSLYRPPLSRHLAHRRPDLRTLWLSAGNFTPVEGDPDGVGNVREMFALYAMAGYVAVGLGNQDLANVEPTRLHTLSERFGIPLVATNVIVRDTGRHAFEESIVVETDGARIGVVSLLEPRPDRAHGDAYSGTLVTVDAAPALRRAVSSLDGRADIVVLLSTLSSSSVALLGDALEGVDFVASGWSGYARPVAEPVGPSRVLWLGDDGLYLGRVTLTDGGAPLAAEVVDVAMPFPVHPQTGRESAGAETAASAP